MKPVMGMKNHLPYQIVAFIKRSLVEIVNYKFQLLTHVLMLVYSTIFLQGGFIDNVLSRFRPWDLQAHSIKQLYSLN
jgi:hypothetical protein